MNDETIAIGVSACLLGEKVRYDGAAKRERRLTDVFGRHLTLVSVCPETELGMGVPRETVDLHGDPVAPRMIGTHSGTDWTARMNAWSRRRTRELLDRSLCGYVFKKNSPSCGVWRVKLFAAPGKYHRRGRGLFAAAFTKRHPLLPVEEEERLRDARLRDNFIERVFAYRRLNLAFAGRWKRSDIIAFNAREEHLLLAHSVKHAKELSRIMAGIDDLGAARFRDEYMRGFMETLAVKTSVRKHVGALRRIAKHLRIQAEERERAGIQGAIDNYRAGLAPLVVPLSLLRHALDVHAISDLANQTYLNPHPKELMLRFGPANN